MEKAFNRFYNIAKGAEWKKPQDIVKTFKNADLVTCKKSNTTRIVFTD